jgi:hypothetical protein
VNGVCRPEASGDAPGWMPSLDEMLEPLAPISLGALEDRAALLRRTDVKYVVERDRLAAVFGRLREDHDVLEIDGRRAFAYETVYFDTSDLRCFREHAAGVIPRFKARTRHYVDAGTCVFEVKIKPAEGETDKHQTGHDAPADVLRPGDEQLLETTLHDAGIAPPDTLEPVLRTSFDRVALAAREGAARLTVDLGVRLASMEGAAVQLRDGLVLIETKSADGESAADSALRALGAQPIGLSKYRTGIDALLRRDDTGELEAVRELFTPLGDRAR